MAGRVRIQEGSVIMNGTEELVSFRACIDCAQVIENGFEGLDLDVEREAEVRAGLGRLRDVTCLSIDRDEESGELVGGFGWYPCQVCGSHLGGDRLRVSGWTC